MTDRALETGGGTLDVQARRPAGGCAGSSSGRAVVSVMLSTNRKGEESVFGSHRSRPNSNILADDRAGGIRIITPGLE